MHALAFSILSRVCQNGSVPGRQLLSYGRSTCLAPRFACIQKGRHARGFSSEQRGRLTRVRGVMCLFIPSIWNSLVQYPHAVVLHAAPLLAVSTGLWVLT